MVLQSEGEAWCKGVLNVLSKSFSCNEPCLEQQFNMGDRMNPENLIRKCNCKPPMKSQLTQDQVITYLKDAKRDNKLMTIEDWA